MEGAPSIHRTGEYASKKGFGAASFADRAERSREVGKVSVLEVHVTGVRGGRRKDIGMAKGEAERAKPSAGGP
jgi:hypothetical protein